MKEYALKDFEKKIDRTELKPFSLYNIQVCPICNKVDVYKDDGHSCLQNSIKKMNEDLLY